MTTRIDDPTEAPGASLRTRARVFVTVAAVAWTFVTLFNAAHRMPHVAIVQAIAAGASILVAIALRHPRAPFALLLHCGTALSAFALAGGAMFTGQGSSPSAWGLLAVPMFVVYLDDARAAAFWMVVVIATIAGIHFSELFVTIAPEGDPQVLVSQIVIALTTLGFARAARRDADLQIAAIAAREAQIGKQAANLTASAADLARARDEAMDASRVKGAFLANMSHEMRTPLNAVLGMGELLAQTELDEVQSEYVAAMRSSADALRGLISDVLDLSKLEAEKVELDVTTFDRLKCVEEAVDVVAAEAVRKKIDLAVHLFPGSPALIRGDFRRMRQVLVNLIGNAVKFTERGSVIIELSGTATEAVFVVRDTGIGISVGDRDRLFAPFTQVDSAATRSAGGTGLGLAISRSLASLFGGEVSFESTMGVGSAFTLRVPVPRDIDARPSDPLDTSSLGAVIVLAETPVRAERMADALTTWGLRSFVVPDAASIATAADGAYAIVVDVDEPIALDVAVAARVQPIVVSDRARVAARRAHDPPSTIVLTRPLKLSRLRDALLGVPTTRSQPSLERRHDTRPLRVLVVDDQPLNRMVASRMLEHLGHEAIEVASGADAIARLLEDPEHHPFDVVLMDVQMPDMTGLQATEQIVEAFAGKRRPRIVALTANALAGDRERCLAVGMDDYLAKPLELAALERALGASSPVGGAKPVPRSELPIIDARVVDDLRLLEQASGGSLLDELFESFLGSAPGIVEGATNAARQGRLDVAEFEAHRLKGNAGTLGLMALAASAHTLEVIARARETARVEDAVGALGNEWRRAEPAIQRLRARRMGRP